MQTAREGFDQPRGECDAKRRRPGFAVFVKKLRAGTGWLARGEVIGAGFSKKTRTEDFGRGGRGWIGIHAECEFSAKAGRRLDSRRAGIKRVLATIPSRDLWSGFEIFPPDG